MLSSEHLDEDRPSALRPFWEDAHLQLWGGDCRAVLAELPAESVHCVVTSPPYWGLRDYGTATWEGGDEACDHSGRKNHDHAGDVGAANESGQHFRNSSRYVDQGEATGPVCRCGARRIDSQLGLEATPEEFVANMVAVFREVRRVLRKDGTLWLNLGDSYAHSTAEMPAQRGILDDGARRYKGPTSERIPGLKPKDLVGIPWRVAFALQADGWYLRSDIIWAKPNPMPESVTDRPTKAHEMVFLLTKSPRYFFDSDAVREADAGTDHPRAVLTGPSLEPSGGLVGPHTGIRTLDGRNGSGRNIRTVWNIATEPYPGAHFATFPRKLVEPCVKAGTSERGVCPECGAPWVRLVDRRPMVIDRSERTHSKGQTRASGTMVDPGETKQLGWDARCPHWMLEPVPAVVLDPFAGSGTTLFVAQALGRRGIGIDLSPEYLEQALARNKQTPLGLVG